MLFRSSYNFGSVLSQESRAPTDHFDSPGLSETWERFGLILVIPFLLALEQIKETIETAPEDQNRL
jgi:hypothetical protein